MGDAATKACCARAYESEAARWLMGETFHPGGLALTARLGEALRLQGGARVLDVACGVGTSALFLAERFGCDVTGVDLSAANVEAARIAAQARGLAGRATFRMGDAERLPFPGAAFDAVVCECAFCLFPDKATAAQEFARVLRRDGRLGLADLVRSGPLGPGLDGLMSWVACLADAWPLDAYVDALADAGLRLEVAERHDAALGEIADHARKRLFAAELLVGLGKLSWPAFDFRAANDLAREAQAAIAGGRLGYALVVAVNSGEPHRGVL